ncbi:MAG: GreA/GreB family elongation factor, partial [Kiritimatiellae bacterium]|nr:GreA/GreB family elongation factor [Kiritimatiellia bacterium]
GFVPGALVMHKVWGVGEVKRLDYFYRRITVDFKNRRGQQLTFQAASETLVRPPENHILVTQKADPARIEMMLKDAPAEFIKEMLRSFGDMSVTRLEELAVQFGFVKSTVWKAFWERARTALREDKLVEVPTRRAEPLHLKNTAETYGDSWFIAFRTNTDPKSILSSVKELGATRIKTLTEDQLANILERLQFALKAARGSNDALYARLAFCLADLRLDLPTIDKARTYLLAGRRYIAAARDLPARDMANLVAFLVANDRETVKRDLFAVLEDMPFPLLSATLEHFSTDADCEEAAAALLRRPHAPATLITYILARYENFGEWKKLPPLAVILTHAIALGEGRQTGETLKMQNTIRRLFADQAWLEKILKQLSAADRALVFERFQASIAWEASTHHMIVMRMTRIDPALAARQVKRDAPKPIERITSIRSYAEKKAAYQHLVNVEIPKNAKDIEFARGYGDLSENFEYQSAKDKERELIQKQTLMQKDLDTVKAVDFADVTADEVRPGTTVVFATTDGAEKSYTILGEWDNDLDKGIISSRAKLAVNLIGKKPGDAFDLPDAEGRVAKATVRAVLPLDDTLKAWVKGA